MLPRFEIIKRRQWHNTVYGTTVSIYGAPPCGKHWEIVENGFTYRDNRSNTNGAGIRGTMAYDAVEALLISMYGQDWRNIPALVN